MKPARYGWKIAVNTGIGSFGLLITCGGVIAIVVLNH